jgi:hypothetical protein
MSRSGTLTLTLIRYLFGDREAIRAVAADPRSVWIGLVFVLAAGFARNYDGEDLLARPWVLLRPLGASLVTGTSLFAVVWAARCVRGWRQGTERPPFAAFRAWLGLYWMTAPLAAFYAVPVEHLTDPVTAAKLNLAALGLVATWRVLLMSRVVGVLTGGGFLRGFSLVMLMADAAVFIGAITSPAVVREVAAGMAGVRVGVSGQVEMIVEAAVGNAAVLAFLTTPVWLILASVVLFHAAPWPTPDADDPTRPLGGDLWAVAAGSLLVWAAVLPFFQPEQRNRTLVESAAARGDWETAIAELSSRDPADFPPGWEPPPDIRVAWDLERLAPAARAMGRREAAPWVRKFYADRAGSLIMSFLNNPWVGERYHGPAFKLPDREDFWRRSAPLFRAWPEGAELERQMLGPLERRIAEAKSPKDVEDDAKLLARIRRLLDEGDRGVTAGGDAADPRD